MLVLIAFATGCGLRPRDVYADEMTELFLTTIHPTAGLVFVEPKFISA